MIPLARIIIFSALTLLPFISPALSQTPPENTNGAIDPDLTPSLFDIESLNISPFDRKSLASMLGTYVKNTYSTGVIQKEIFTKCLKVAFSLDPDNKEAFLANHYLKNNTPPPKTSTMPPNPKLLWNKIITIIEKLSQTENQENRRVSANIAEITIMADPSNETAIYILEKLKNSGITPIWEVIAQRKDSSTTQTSDTPAIPDTPIKGIIVKKETPPAFQSKAKPFIIQQTSIRALSVISLQSTGKYAGAPIKIILTVAPQKSNSEEILTNTTDVGKMMTKSLEEAGRIAHIRYPKWEKNILNISFDDQYTIKDGPSATAAFTLLVLSALDGIPLDENIGITGNLSVDWKTQPVGEVGAKIRGAIAQKCSIAIIPESTKDQIKDWLVLNANSYEQIPKVQIFTTTNLEEIVEIARKDRPENLQTAINTFSTIQENLNKKIYIPRNGNKEYYSKLKEVLQNYPNHLTARILMEYEDRANPTCLSLNGSAHQLLLVGKPFFKWLDNGNRNVNQFHFTEGEYDDALNSLYLLRTRLDPRTSELHGKLNGMIRKWRELDDLLQKGGRRGEILKNIEEANQSLSKVQDSIKALLTNEEYVEEMLN